MKDFLYNIISDIKYENFLHSDIGKMLFFVVVIVLVSFLINYFLSHSVIGSGYRVFVAPGVIIHEFSHAIFCVLTGAKIRSISLFDKDGGRVEHEKPKIPVLGQILISLSPILIGTLIIYFLSKMIGLKDIGIQFNSLADINIYNYFVTVINNLKFSDIKTWIIMYVIISVAVTMTPSTKDIANIAISLVVGLIVLCLIVHYTAINFVTFFIMSPMVVTFLVTVLLLLILCLVLSILIYTLSKLFKL